MPFYDIYSNYNANQRLKYFDALNKRYCAIYLIVYLYYSIDIIVKS